MLRNINHCLECGCIQDDSVSNVCVYLILNMSSLLLQNFAETRFLTQKESTATRSNAQQFVVANYLVNCHLKHKKESFLQDETFKRDNWMHLKVFAAITLLLRQVTINGWKWLPGPGFWNPIQQKITVSGSAKNITSTYPTIPFFDNDLASFCHNLAVHFFWK